jgi:hypothetical protein
VTDTPDEGRGRESQKPTEPPAAKGSGVGTYRQIYDATGKVVFGSAAAGEPVSELGLLRSQLWGNVLIDHQAQNEFPQHPLGEMRADTLYRLQPKEGKELPEGVTHGGPNYLLIEMASGFSHDHLRKYSTYAAGIFGKFYKDKTMPFSLTLVVIYGQNAKP